MKQNEVSLGRFLRIVLIVMAIALSYIILDSLSGVLLPFAIAWLLAYFINPLVNFIQNRLCFKYRVPSIVTALLLIFLVIYLMALLIVPSMYEELYSLRHLTVSFLNENIKNSSIPAPVIEFFKELSNRQGLGEFLQQAGDSSLLSLCVERMQILLLGTLNMVGQVLTMCVMFLYLFFILLDFERLTKGWKPYVPRKWRGVVAKLWSDLVRGMNQYFRGQALVALCVGVLFALGFTIIDFPVAIGFGLFIGILNLVPYLQLVSLVPMVLLAVLKAANTGEDFWIIILSAFAVLAIVQLIQDLLLVPYIMGKRMNLHPAVILLSLSIWGQLLGVLGMIVALPLTTLILAYIRRYHEIAEKFDYTEGRMIKEIIDTADVSNGKHSKQKTS